jgi:hypothetical protein
VGWFHFKTKQLQPIFDEVNRSGSQLGEAN